MSNLDLDKMDHHDLKQISAGLGTYAGTRLVTLEDGVERGMRVVEMRSGGGLDFDVVVDRCGDIGRLCFEGQVLSWHTPNGLTSPWLMNHEGDNGQGFLRGYGGFLNTCGLDHIRQPDEDELVEANQDFLKQVRFPLHGKGTFQPSILRGHGLDDDGEKPYIFCEMEFIQAMSFTSSLRLRRRIEVPVGSSTITIKDTVKNIGNNASSHMLLYHFNLGFPLVAKGTSFDFGNDVCVWKSHEHNPLALMTSPNKDRKNEIAIFRHERENALVQINKPNAGLLLQIDYPSSQLPYCQFLRLSKPGIYGVGLEPCTTGGRDRAQAREQRELLILQPEDERKYHLSISITKAAK